ncbi:hypothetical protein OIU76_013005 [Salix suchowensis]|nr:hypothetical protein OIU76_013005 [Salix suchowensis]
MRNVELTVRETGMWAALSVAAAGEERRGVVVGLGEERLTLRWVGGLAGPEMGERGFSFSESSVRREGGEEKGIG